MYLTDDTRVTTAITDMVNEYALNVQQKLAFTIVARHSFGIGPKCNDQLLLGLFGEGGTGKSRVINAIKAWFLRCGRMDELLVTATTGTAAPKLKDGRFTARLECAKKVNFLSCPTNKSEELWRSKNYLIVDEISMLDKSLMSKYTHS